MPGQAGSQVFATGVIGDMSDMLDRLIGAGMAQMSHRDAIHTAMAAILMNGCLKNVIGGDLFNGWGRQGGRRMAAMGMCL